MRAWEKGTATLKVNKKAASGENNAWLHREKCCGAGLD